MTLTCMHTVKIGKALKYIQNVVRDLAHASYHSQASCVIVSGFRTALELDTYPLSKLIRERCAEQAKPGRGKPVPIMHYWIFCLFSRHIFRTAYLSNAVQRNRQTDKQKDKQTDTQTKYCNPRCACAPRVNKGHSTLYY